MAGGGSADATGAAGSADATDATGQFAERVRWLSQAIQVCRESASGDFYASLASLAGLAGLASLFCLLAAPEYDDVLAAYPELRDTTLDKARGAAPPWRMTPTAGSFSTG